MAKGLGRLGSKLVRQVLSAPDRDGQSVGQVAP